MSRLAPPLQALRSSCVLPFPLLPRLPSSPSFPIVVNNHPESAWNFSWHDFCLGILIKQSSIMVSPWHRVSPVPQICRWPLQIVFVLWAIEIMSRQNDFLVRDYTLHHRCTVYKYPHLQQFSNTTRYRVQTHTDRLFKLTRQAGNCWTFGTEEHQPRNQLRKERSSTLRKSLTRWNSDAENDKTQNSGEQLNTRSFLNVGMV